jgi:hypothetical protein
MGLLGLPVMLEVGDAPLEEFNVLDESKHRVTPGTKEFPYGIGLVIVI